MRTSGVVSRMIVVVLSGSIALGTSGCSFLAGSTQSLSVTTSEPDAEILVNGEAVGTGSATALVRRDQTTSVLVRKEGYHSSQATIGYSLSTVGVLDVVGGVLFLVPLLGLIAPGSRSLDRDSVVLIMEKDHTSTAAKHARVEREDGGDDK